MTKKDKIISCFGKLTAKSTAIVCNASNSLVWNIWNENELKVKEIKNIRRNPYL